MKYYAVTDDPTELMHFGIKGMHWGVVRTPAQLGHPRHAGSRRPRSAAYKKAQSKLGRAMKSGIKKVETKWKTYNSPKAKEARFMNKAMEKARTGTLKYGKLTDDQVRRVTERLALERNARQLGATENPKFSKRVKSAIGEGIIRGIGQGTGAYIEERFRGRGRTTAEFKAENRRLKRDSNKYIQSQKAYNKQLEEFYKTASEEGDNPDYWKYGTASQRAKYLSGVKSRKEQEAYAADLQKKYDEQVALARGRYDGGRYGLERETRKISPSTSNGWARLIESNDAFERRNAAIEKELIRVERQQAAERRRAADMIVTSNKRKRNTGRRR